MQRQPEASAPQELAHAPLIVRLLYKLFGILLGVLAGVLGRNLTKQLWYGATGDEALPRATDRYRSWNQVIVAAMMRGAVFAVTRALVQRAGATGYERLTGSWPGRVSAAKSREPRP